KRLIRLDRASAALQVIVRVAELFERSSGGRDECGRTAELARRFLEVPATLVGFGEPQMREHRLGSKGDGAAVRLDGAERLIVPQSRIAARQLGSVVPLPGALLIGHGPGHPREGEENDGNQRTFHVLFAYGNSPAGTFSPFRGLLFYSGRSYPPRGTICRGTLREAGTRCRMVGRRRSRGDAHPAVRRRGRNGLLRPRR